MVDIGVLTLGIVAAALLLRCLSSEIFSCCKSYHVNAQGLRRPLLQPEIDRNSDFPRFFLLRRKHFRWLREGMAWMLATIYFIRATMKLHDGTDGTTRNDGIRLLLLGLNWLLLSQIEECPPYIWSSTMAYQSDVQSLEGIPWVTLALGYLAFFGLSVHPLLSQTENGLIGVYIIQCAACGLILFLLLIEVILEVFERKRFKTHYSKDKSDWTKSSFFLLRMSHEAPNVEQSSSFFSFLLFRWMNPIVQLGKKKVLEMKDLFPQEQEDMSPYIWQRFLPHLLKLQRRKALKKKRDGFGLLWALIETWPIMFWSLCLFLFISVVASFGVPLSLKFLVHFISTYEKGDVIPVRAYLSAAVLFFAPALAALSSGQQTHLGRRLIFRWRSALISLIFHQTLRIDPWVGSYSSGRTINLVSVDASNVDGLRYLPYIFAVPLQIFLTMGLIFWVLQSWISGLIGVACLTLAAYFTVQLSHLQRKAQKELMRRKDTRLASLSEGLQGIRIIKLLAWEKAFADKLDKARIIELQSLKSFVLLRCAISILWTSAPILVSVLTFIFHTLVLKKTLSPSQGYTTLALFGVLRDPLSSLNTYLNNWIKMQVSLARIERFILDTVLLQDYEGKLLTRIEVEETQEEEEERGYKGQVCIEGDSFGWSQYDTDGHLRVDYLLKDVRLHSSPGDLVCIYGPTGCGKTTLLLGILKEIRHAKAGVVAGSTVANSEAETPSALKGGAKKTTYAHGRVAYAAQRPFILNATVRDNILFGKKMVDPDFYEACIEACALQPDLESWEGGDLTEIGEHGQILSGGQMARLSLCRAVYHQADVLLLDDILSAVDVHVGQHLMKFCLLNPAVVRGATIILVTHQISMTLAHADQALVFNRDGSLALHGHPRSCPPEEHNNTDFLEFMRLHLRNQDRVEDPSSIISKKENEAKTMVQGAGEGKALIKAEEKAEGRVRWEVYLAYMMACGGVIVALWTLVLFAAVEGLNYFQNKALGDWVEEIQTNSEHSTVSNKGFYPYLYFSAASICVLILQALLLSWSSLRASREIHQKMTTHVLRAPMSWFETTPSGRIQNRFSFDLETLDIDIMDTISKFIGRLASIVTITAVISASMYPLMFGILPILAFSSYFGYCYQQSSRELKRLESITRSPIFSCFSETVEGLATIRAYRSQTVFMQQIYGALDANNRVYHHLWSLNRWLAVRLQLLGAAITGMVGLYIMLTLGDVSPPTAGLVLLFCIGFADNVNTLIRQQAEMEMDFNSVERAAIEYTHYLPQEKPALNSDYPPPDSHWPSKGHIRLQHVYMRYPNTEVDVLKDLCIDIPAHTRVGIIGRTGAGKTSLISCLFRLVEPYTPRRNQDICMSIDGVDIMKLGLQDLRSRLSIVPQEPILFQGTVRSNLDPFHQSSDAELWSVLEKTQLKGQVVASLQDPVQEKGSNFSMGERQLLALARALVRLNDRSVLVLDEPTSYIDYKADGLIQDMVRKDLRGCTVICVAHRLRTVAYYDLILLMKKGEIVERGPPLKLLQDKNSQFQQMALETGEYEVLLEIARQEQKSHHRKKLD